MSPLKYILLVSLKKWDGLQSSVFRIYCILTLAPADVRIQPSSPQGEIPGAVSHPQGGRYIFLVSFAFVQSLFWVGWGFYLTIFFSLLPLPSPSPLFFWRAYYLPLCFSFCI